MIELLYAVLDNEFETGFVNKFPNGIDKFLMAMFQTPVMIEYAGTLKRYPAHTAIFYAPNQYIHFEACSDCNLRHDWLQFYCDEPFLTDDFIPSGKPFHIDFYYGMRSYFEHIAYENIKGHKSRDFVLTQLMLIVLHRFSELSSLAKNTPYADALQTLRDDIYKNPTESWSLEMMAARVNISTRLLQNKYREFFGDSCMNDVITSRIQYSKQLLLSTDLPIHEIGQLSGYKNTEHFCRQFKEKTGYTPKAYRKKGISDRRFPPNMSMANLL